MIIGAAATLLQERHYVGTSTTFIGPVKKPATLVKTDLITTKYQDLADPEVDFLVLIPADGRVTFRIEGEEEKLVKQELNEVTQAYLKDVNASYKPLKEENDTRVNDLKTKIDFWEAIKKESAEKYNSNTLEPQQSERQYKRIVESEEFITELTSELETAEEKSQEIIEEPKTISKDVSKEQGNMVMNALVGLILGLFITVLTLILWKYIIDAKGASNRD